MRHEDRWAYQLRRAQEQVVRIERKITADPASVRAEGWRRRLRETCRDIANYQTALKNAGIALPE